MHLYNRAGNILVWRTPLLALKIIADHNGYGNLQSIWKIMYMTEREKLEVEFYDEGRNKVSNSNLSIEQRKLIVTSFVVTSLDT